MTLILSGNWNLSRPGQEDFTMEQPYELYPSLLKDYCFAAVGSWILSPGVRFMRVDEETYCELNRQNFPKNSKPTLCSPYP